MSKARTQGASPTRKKIPNGTIAARRTARRARALIECMLKEMELGLADPDYRTSDEWERLFGAKQSMVVNLQKLVAALAAVPSYETMPEKDAAVARDAPITASEMNMLQDWLNEGNAGEMAEID